MVWRARKHKVDQSAAKRIWPYFYQKYQGQGLVPCEGYAEPHGFTPSSKESLQLHARNTHPPYAVPNPVKAETQKTRVILFQFYLQFRGNLVARKKA